MGTLKYLRENWKQISSLTTIITGFYMGCVSIFILTDTKLPIVVVLSGSMEPTYNIGDLLFVTDHKYEEVNLGDAIVFKTPAFGAAYIVHRVHRIHVSKENGTRRYLTKGDNNEHDDREMYEPDKLWLDDEDIHSKIRGYLPYLGYATILFMEYPSMKVITIVITALIFFKDISND